MPFYLYRYRWILEHDTTGLAEYGNTIRSNVPDVVPLVDNLDSQRLPNPDGIPDSFNRATHVHIETKLRRCGSWACE